MKLREKTGCGEYGDRILALANGVVRITGGIIFLFLTWYAFRYTQYMLPGGTELPVEVRDSMKGNLLAVVVLTGLFLGLLKLEKHVAPRIQWQTMQVTLLVTMLWIGAVGTWWILSAERVPSGDQAFIYGGASYFLEGNYLFLEEGGYCSMYPHQLGLIALTELLFLVAGPMNYRAFQAICVLLTMGIVYLGYRIVKELTAHTAVVLVYCVMMMGCLPMVFYTGWVYGDIPSIFFTLLMQVMLLQYGKSRKKRYLAGVVLSALMGLLVRKNSAILLIALCLVIGVSVIQQMDNKLILTAILAVVVPVLAYQGIYKMYELRSGHERYDAIPTISWVAMGLQENNGKYGWYNDYSKLVFYGNDCNADYATVAIRMDMKERVRELKGDLSYSRQFFKEKILSQWNEPLYQSLFFTSDYEGMKKFTDPDAFATRLGREYLPYVIRVCDRLQFLIYLGTACYFLFAVKKDSNILHHLLAVMAIGGFFFSIIWEAKARYTLPYYVTMFPCAVIGYEQLLYRVAAFLEKVRRRKQAEGEKKVDRIGKAA